MRRCLAALWLCSAALVAPAHGAEPPALTSQRQAQDQMRAGAMADPQVRADYLMVYAEMQRSDLAHQKSYQQQLAIDLARYQRDARSASDDLDARRRTLAAYAVFDVLNFIIVSLVVGCGLWFSYLQFSVDRRTHAQVQALMRHIGAMAADDPLRPVLAARIETLGQRPASTFEAGPIKVSSPVIGLVVLATSLAFYSLYLTHVYAVQQLPSADASLAKGANAASASTAPAPSTPPASAVAR